MLAKNESELIKRERRLNQKEEKSNKKTKLERRENEKNINKIPGVDSSNCLSAS